MVKYSYVSKVSFAIRAVNMGGNSAPGSAAGSLRFSVMTQDFQFLCKQRLLRPYSGRISIFHDKKPCLALLALVLIKLILLNHSISEILYTIITLKRVVTIVYWLYSQLFCP